jgi:four helix bundle protein
MIYNVTDLEVYKLSIDLLKDLYLFLLKVPNSEFDTIKNCKRAGKSIPANLAEGFAKRKSEATFKNHLQICIGSSDEVVAHIMTIAAVVPKITNEANIIAEKYIVLSKRLNTLHKNWKSYQF